MLSRLNQDFLPTQNVFFPTHAPWRKMRKTRHGFLVLFFFFNSQVRLFQRWKLPDFSLIWCFDFPGYPENMPSLQPHQNSVCEIHLKVSTTEWKPHARGLCHFSPVVILLAFCFLRPDILLSTEHALVHVIFTVAIKGRSSHYPHFMDEEVEAQEESQGHTAVRGRPSPGRVHPEHLHAALAVCFLFSCVQADTLVP